MVITAFTSIALSVGANRIVFGGDFICPAGNPEIPLEREKYFRKMILLKALKALQTEVDKPTLFTIREE